MCHLVALILVLGLTLGLVAPAAYAGDTATDVALGLAAFAVFNQLVGPYLHPSPNHAAPVYVYQSPPPTVVYYTPPQVVVIEPPSQVVVIERAPVYHVPAVTHYKIPPGHWKKAGPPPWAGGWKKYKKWEDD